MSGALSGGIRSRSPRMVGTMAVIVGRSLATIFMMPSTCRCGPGMSMSLPLNQPL